MRACLMCVWGVATPIAVETFFENMLSAGMLCLSANLSAELSAVPELQMTGLQMAGVTNECCLLNYNLI